MIEIQNESILNKELKRNDVTDVYVCGLCTDICVGKVNIFMMSIKMFLGPLGPLAVALSVCMSVILVNCNTVTLHIHSTAAL